MDCSLPGSSVHGLFQARVLEWVAISFSRGSSQPRDRTQISRIAGSCFTIWITTEAKPTVEGLFFTGLPRATVIRNINWQFQLKLILQLETKQNKTVGKKWKLSGRWISWISQPEARVKAPGTQSFQPGETPGWKSLVTTIYHLKEHIFNATPGTRKPGFSRKMEFKNFEYAER